MQLSPEQHRWFSEVRRCWLTDIQPYAEYGYRLFPAYPELPQEVLSDAKIFTNRNLALELLPKDGNGIEVGTQTGLFARELLRATQPRSLALLDIDDTQLKAVCPELLRDPRVRLILGDSAATLQSFPDASLDWIYIDANHSYEGVSKDLAVSVRKVRPGGLVIFNDYVHWSALEMLPYGVVQAVNEFVHEARWPVVYFAFGRLMYCDIAIRRPAARDAIEVAQERSAETDRDHFIEGMNRRAADEEFHRITARRTD